MTFRACLLAAAAGLAFATATPARAAIEEGYDPTVAPVPSTWYEPANPAALRADRDYVAGMRPHHAGALTMARDYLADTQASSPVLKALAVAIIRNQSFEIGVLDEVSRNLDRPPIVLNLGFTRISLQPSATEGLAQLRTFQRSPIPGPAAALADPGAPVTARDVQFAKGMTIHHQAALDMARAYHANSEARNGFLGLMNVDIITDQSQEIALMRRVIAAYPGNPDAVRVDASMIHGMEGMQHGAHASQPAGGAAAGSGHGGHADVTMPQAAPQASGQGQAAERTPTMPSAQPAAQREAARNGAHGHAEHMH
ncbi:DUF305 domain-containing protein [Paracraurococcus lichenis]|uniref:DUF305 domain-containing protein n=1 Tax=Paracraurococcus lichenis TaxID=3064888 RepID=A0ABT9EC70_9PROT|nr:DUF305 domain-containing protein [Paracraurococcus sp. LOR1-02]MDO9713811.1 DUF305 domain-containing protein [Paracraurococcus sp. LOR1-02]